MLITHRLLLAIVTAVLAGAPALAESLNEPTTAVSHSKPDAAAEVDYCNVVDLDGDISVDHCASSSNGSIRCYADVQFSPNGPEHRVWGQGCYASFGDCWWSGAGAVNPCE